MASFDEPPTSTTVHLRATYTSPSTSHEPLTLSSTPLALPAPASLSVETKSAYLRLLRTAAAALQDRINGELTARMEEDNKKARESAPGAGDAGGGGVVGAKRNTRGANEVDEAAEEENYGEELQEEEEEV
ncbi:hypothetical protein F5Y19DRAFT_276876 [Xylariaceae sp. FL1651]|nr:hypothetical protein F5Y19DRAFT_276876 [Xylariaceae sp. FL1651]